MITNRLNSPAESRKTASNAPINVDKQDKQISAAAGEKVEFPCEKPSSWLNHESPSWVRLTAKDAAQCTKGLKRIDDYLWFCDVLVSNRIVQSDFKERFSVGPLGSAEENHLTLKSATPEDMGRYICLRNRTKEIAKIYNLIIQFVTATVESSSNRSDSRTTDSRSLYSTAVVQSTTPEDNRLNASISIVAVCVVVVVAIIVMVVIILIGKRRNDNIDNSRAFEEGQRNVTAEPSLYTDMTDIGGHRSERPEPHSQEFRSDDGLIYLELTTENGIEGNRPTMHPIACRFNCSIYAAIDHNA